MSAALVVLAGGRGARLGGLVKPLLVRPDGRTLVENVVAVLAPLVDETLIVAPPALAALFAGRVIEDAGLGPARALLAAAGATGAERILLVGGDHVAPSAPLAERLLSAEAPAAAVSVGGVLQPTFAMYAAGPLRALDPAPASLRAILEKLGPFVIDEEEIDPEMLAAFEDVDTEADRVRHGLSAEGVPTWSQLAGGRV